MLFRYSLTTKLRTVVTTDFYQSTHVKVFRPLPWVLFCCLLLILGGHVPGIAQIHWDHTIIWLDIDLALEMVRKRNVRFRQYCSDLFPA